MTEKPNFTPPTKEEVVARYKSSIDIFMQLMLEAAKPEVPEDLRIEVFKRILSCHMDELMIAVGLMAFGYGKCGPDDSQLITSRFAHTLVQSMDSDSRKNLNVSVVTMMNITRPDESWDDLLDLI